MGIRRRGRELAFQVLYQMDMGRTTIEYALDHPFILQAHSPWDAMDFNPRDFTRGWANRFTICSKVLCESHIEPIQVLQRNDRRCEHEIVARRLSDSS